MKIVNLQRNELMFIQETDTFEELQNLETIKNSCYDHIAEPITDELIGLQRIDENEAIEEVGLADKELNKQE